MSHYYKHTSLKQWRSRTDPVWHWLLRSGPQGPSFTWRKDPSAPYWRSGPQALDEEISARTATDPEFREKAHQAAIEALAVDSPEVVCRGIQLLSALADGADLERLRSLCNHLDASISRAAKACLFHLGERP